MHHLSTPPNAVTTSVMFRPHLHIQVFLIHDVHGRAKTGEKGTSAGVINKHRASAFLIIMTGTVQIYDKKDLDNKDNAGSS